MKPLSLIFRIALALVMLALLLYVWEVRPQRAEKQDAGTPGTSVGADAAVVEAFNKRQSAVWLEAHGVVDRLLADDERGSRHQKFILRLDNGHTLLISHNIDLAPRVEDLSPGDPIAFRGQYEWNDKGGVVHWTHHDPDGHRPGGWVRHDGREYR